ncbi:MAG: heme biosynthesis HemY N-terminal domain-containing protein [Pseudomonadota bacterium]
MKVMVALVLAVLMALAAIWALPLLRGYVLIRADGWAVEMNVFVLLVILASTYVVGRLLIWLWNLPGNAVRGFFQRRAAAQLEIGMLALSEGDWQKAEKALSKAARRGDHAALSYIGAAQAAAGTGHDERVEGYLEHADETSRAHDSVLITRASLQLASGHPEEALSTLNELNRTREGRPRVLQIKASALEQLGRWSELANLTPALVKAGIVDEDQRQRLVRKAALATLEGAADAGALQSAWKGLPRAQKAMPQFLSAFASHAQALGAAEMTTKPLRAYLNNEWSETLLADYARAETDDTRRTTQLEKWLKQHPDSPGLHLFLARHCVTRELWGKAREHLETSVQLRPDAEAWAELAELKMRDGDLEGAVASYRQATQRDPLPPGPALLTAEDE